MNTLLQQRGVKSHVFESPFQTENGDLIPKLELAYKTYGKLNRTRDNVVVICHALTGHAAAEEWFPGLFIEDSFLGDPRWFVICVNVPGSCYGSTGPISLNPQNGKPYRADFPELTIRDYVRAQQLLMDELGVNGIDLVVGGSMGGMQALEFVLTDDRVKKAAVIAAGARHEPWAIGISEAQRAAIFADANWNGGYYETGAEPKKGIASARMMAMITYRSHAQFVQRFGREHQHKGPLFQVQSYLQYQGEKLAKRFDANTYVRLTQAMDTHDVGRERGGVKKVLKGCNKPVLVCGIDSDILYPVAEQKKLAKDLPRGIYRELTSPYGHDAFLIEFEWLQQQLQEFIELYQDDHNSRN